MTDNTKKGAARYDVEVLDERGEYGETGKWVKTACMNYASQMEAASALAALKDEHGDFYRIVQAAPEGESETPCKFCRSRGYRTCDFGSFCFNQDKRPSAPSVSSEKPAIEDPMARTVLRATDKNFALRDDLIPLRARLVQAGYIHEFTAYELTDKGREAAGLEKDDEE